MHLLPLQECCLLQVFQKCTLFLVDIRFHTTKCMSAYVRIPDLSSLGYWHDMSMFPNHQYYWQSLDIHQVLTFKTISRSSNNISHIYHVFCFGCLQKAALSYIFSMNSIVVFGDISKSGATFLLLAQTLTLSRVVPFDTTVQIFTGVVFIFVNTDI